MSFFLSLGRPRETALKRLLEEARAQPLSYSQLGMTAQGTPPAGFARRETRVHLGHGEEVFARAVAGLNAWAVYPPWMTLYPTRAPIERGTCVALATGLGLWTLSAVRVTEVENSPRHFSFTLGTLPQHAVSGEERFAALWQTDDSVWYELVAVSKPQHPLVKLGSPVLALVQRRFAGDSARSLRAFVETGLRGG